MHIIRYLNRVFFNAYKCSNDSKNPRVLEDCLWRDANEGNANARGVLEKDYLVGLQSCFLNCHVLQICCGSLQKNGF